MSTKLSELVDTARTVVKAVGSRVSPEKRLLPLFRDRHLICLSCPGDFYENKTCKLCGCIVGLKAYSHSINQHGRVEDCPAGYWYPKLYSDQQGEYILVKELPESLQLELEGKEFLTYEEWIRFLND